MNGLINQHLIQFLSIVIAVIAYVILHISIRYTAIFISGQKTGVIRQCLQGFCAVASFVVAMLISCNGAIRYYHVLTYVLLLIAVMKIGKYLTIVIEKRAKKHSEATSNSVSKPL